MDCRPYFEDLEKRLEKSGIFWLKKRGREQDFYYLNSLNTLLIELGIPSQKLQRRVDIVLEDDEGKRTPYFYCFYGVSLHGQIYAGNETGWDAIAEVAYKHRYAYWQEKNKEIIEHHLTDEITISHPNETGRNNMLREINERNGWDTLWEWKREFEAAVLREFTPQSPARVGKVRL